MTLAKLRIVGIHLLVLSAVAGAGAAASFRFARVPARWTLPSYPQLAGRPGQGSVNPIVLALAGRPAATATAGVPRPVPRIRAITVSPNWITLRAGGRVVETIPIVGHALNLSQITQAVADPSWISQPAPGVIDLRAALIMETGTSLTVAPPSVARAPMIADRPGVFLAPPMARCSDQIRHGHIVAPPGYADAYRPFVLAENRASMWITSSRLAGLGWNWDDSYGVSWKTGSTGGATGSTFTGNYFGVYTRAGPAW